MTSTLGDLLLVLLADEPGTANELQQRHARTFGQEHAIDVTRIISTLTRQERLGYLRAEIAQARGARPVCSVTEAGRRRQQAWLLELGPEASEADVRDRVLLAVTATDRPTFDTVLGSCIAAMEARRRRADVGEPAAAVSVREALAEFDGAMTSSVLDWLHHLRGRPRTRDVTA
ncbi:hypothetical protein ACWKSP_04015 [Micromonosporaceae bacterium Da 78-11]